ncbi:MAG: class I SAM-dependent methyltransferase [Candidatus Nanoarchaeia archaeon]|nr:class I SAM-dependent methyltransferase [Candidatus Nanoarchaeia archaeon]
MVMSHIGPKDYCEWKSFDRLYQKIRIKEVIKNIKGKSVLELGCQYGHILSRIQKEKGITSIVGVDIDKKAIKIARALHPGMTFINQDIMQYNPKIKFDKVILPEIVEHLEFPDVILKKAQALARYRIIITVPNKEKFACDRNKLKETIHYQIFDETRLRRMLCRNLKFKRLKIIPVAKDTIFQRNQLLKRIAGRILYYLNLDNIVKLKANSLNSMFLVAVIDL